MANDRRYKRYFIILENEDRGFERTDKQMPKGYAKIEVRNGKGLLNVYVQDLKYFNDAKYIYRNYLISTKGEKNSYVDTGAFIIDERGKGELKVKFDPDNVEGSEKAIEDFDVVAVIAKPIERTSEQMEVYGPLVGYIEKEKKNWKDVLAYEDNKKKEQNEKEIKEKEIKENIETDDTLDKEYKQKYEKIIDVIEKSSKDIYKEDVAAKEEAKENVKKEEYKEKDNKAVSESKDKKKENEQEKCAECVDSLEQYDNQQVDEEIKEEKYNNKKKDKEIDNRKQNEKENVYYKENKYTKKEEVKEEIESNKNEGIQEPIEQSKKESIQKPIEENKKESMQKPIEQNKKESIQELIEKSKKESIQKPIEENKKESMQEPIEENEKQSIQEPIEQNNKKDIQESINKDNKKQNQIANEQAQQKEDISPEKKEGIKQEKPAKKEENIIKDASKDKKKEIQEAEKNEPKAGKKKQYEKEKKEYSNKYSNSRSNVHYKKYHKMVYKYVKDTLNYHEKIQPFEKNIEGYTWWKIKYDNQSMHRGFLPFFGYILNIYYYNPYIYYMNNCQSLMNKYGHYIFGIAYDKDREPTYYVYGVPGRYMKEDQPFQGMTGFIYWYPLEDKNPERGDYGYWLLHIDAKTGNAVFPMKPVIPPRY